jgi:CHASE2 domain-containing sensor protein
VQGAVQARPAGRGIALESLLLATVALVVLNFHPFGSAHLRRHFSQDLVYAWFGDAHWLYPRASSSVLGRSPPRAVVVLVDDRALALRGAQWPVPIVFHAQLLAELEVLRPRAVMLDFLLIERAAPDDACALLRSADTLHGEGIPVYLAVAAREDLASLDAPHCLNHAGQPLDPGRLLIPVPVGRLYDDADFVSRRYPFEDAAVRMYCDAAGGGPCVATLTGGGSPDAGFDLAWSPAADPFNDRWSRTGCTPPARSRVLFAAGVLPRETACPPIATLFASALLSPAEDSGFGARNEQLFALMEDSFVFVGGNFRGSGDLITTPMHTQLPGVYYHAAAFENLVAFDGKPKIREEYRPFKVGIYLYDLSVLWAMAAIFLWRERWIAAVTFEGEALFAPSTAARARVAKLIAHTPAVLSLAALVLAALMLAAYPTLQAVSILAAVVSWVLLEILVVSRLELKMRVRAGAIYAAALGLSLAVVACAIWIGYRWLRLPPGDWVGYLSFATVGFFVAHGAIVDFGRHVGSLRAANAVEGDTE